MTVEYSGSIEDGRSLGAVGWRLLTLGLVVALVGAAIPLAIVLVVILYSLSLRGL